MDSAIIFFHCLIHARGPRATTPSRSSEAWREIYGGWDPDEEVVVYEFKLLENRNQAKLNGLDPRKDQ
jgi:hypothetical protein